jgi:hypothetical protein
VFPRNQESVVLKKEILMATTTDIPTRASPFLLDIPAHVTWTVSLATMVAFDQTIGTNHKFTRRLRAADALETGTAVSVLAPLTNGKPTTRAPLDALLTCHDMAGTTVHGLVVRTENIIRLTELTKNIRPRHYRMPFWIASTKLG